MYRRLRYGKFGLLENPIGKHVKLEYGGRVLLGDVIAAKRCEARGAVILTVKHFCGDLWPIQPAASAVIVIG